MRGLRLLALLFVLALVATACGDSAETPTTTAAPETPTATTQLPATTQPKATTQAATTTVVTPAVVDGVLSEQLARFSVPEGDGAFMVAVVDASGAVEYASEGSDPAGSLLTPDAVFRIGSITKTFTAALTLTLVDDGVVELDSPATDYITRVGVGEGVTVRDLLQHSSGIPNYTDLVSQLVSRALDDPQRVWLPEETIGLVEDRELLFEPGARFSYSNTNYAILGVLIEEVSGSSFAAVLRARLLEPLGLDSTYLDGFEDGQEPFGAYTTFGVTNNSAELVDFEYTAIATDAWAAGAIVSSVEDLHAFFSALFDEQVVSAESLAAMTRNEEYGFGIVRISAVEELYGHGGGIPGYLTFVIHAPDTGKTAVWVVTNDTANFDRTIEPVAGYISQG